MIGIIAGAIKLIGFIPYIISIVRGRTKQSKASWFVWMVLTWIFAVSYWQSGARNTLWVPIAAMFATTLVALLSIKYGERGWTSFDKKCLVAATFGLLLWWIFDNPLLAVLTSLTVDIIGALPTMRKVWKNPGSEDKISWTIFIASSVVNVFAIEQWVFAVAVYPVIMLISDSIIFVPLWLKKHE